MRMSVPKSEAAWEAQCDARTLMEADLINADPKRLAAAQKAAKGMANDKKDEAEAMAKIAEKKASVGKK